MLPATAPHPPTTDTRALFAGTSGTQVAITTYEHPDDYGQAFPADDPTERTCTLCRNPIAAIENDDRPTYRWRLVVAVQIAGPGGADVSRTEFCEDCFSWVEDIAPAITEHASRYR